MTLPRTILAALAVSLSLFSAGFAAPPAPPADIVARFEGATQITTGRPATIIAITDMSTGKKGSIPIPNVTTKVDKVDKQVPKPELVEAVKKLTPGQYVKISVEPTKDQGTVLSTIDPYELKPGEDTPNGYVFSKTFDKTVGKNTTTMVVLTKFGAEHNFSIAMRKGDTGQEQDPDVVAAIGKLSPDSGVWVQTQGRTVITAIEPYTEPKTGKVTKLADADVDGHKVKTAEIDTDGKSVTVYVPGKESGKTFIADAAILAQLGKVKVNSQVEFRVHEDSDKLWLREIEVAKPAPKKPAEKPAPPAKK